jgi:hypothetical protein
LTNSKTNVAWEFAYKLDGSNILSGKFNSLGTFDYESLSQEDLGDDMEAMALVLDSANVSIQLGNIKVTGLVGFNKLASEYNATFGSEMDGSETDYIKLARIFNKFVKLYVLYADDKTVIAKSHFYKKEYTNDYWYYYWNGDEYVQQFNEDTYYDLGLQFEFKDGSYMDQSFFDDGFDDLKSSFEEMLNDLNVNYGE